MIIWLDASTAWVAIAVVAVVLLILLLNKKMGWIRVRLPGAEVSAGESGKGASIKDSTSTNGNIVASDHTGVKASVEGSIAQKDIRAEVKGGSSPKR